MSRYGVKCSDMHDRFYLRQSFSKSQGRNRVIIIVKDEHTVSFYKKKKRKNLQIAPLPLLSKVKQTTFSYNMCENGTLSRNKKFWNLRSLLKGHNGIRGGRTRLSRTWDETFKDIRSNGHVSVRRPTLVWSCDSAVCMNGLAAKCNVM